MSYTYSTLYDDIIATMEEDSAEFVAALPTIISRAQNYLQRRIDPVNILRFVEVSVSASTRTLELPTDVLVIKSVQVCASGGWNNLIQQTNEYLTAYWPDYASCAPTKYYAAKDNLQLFLAPTPATGGLAHLEYVPKVTILSSALPSNWFSENAEAAFFAACMMYTNLWSKNQAGADRWKSVADEELFAINNEARRARRSDTSDRSQGAPENNIGEGA
jgi:hypothetical protein